MTKVQENCRKVMRAIAKGLIGNGNYYYDVNWNENGDLELYVWKPPMSRLDGFYSVIFKQSFYAEIFKRRCAEIREWMTRVDVGKVASINDREAEAGI